MGIPARNRFKNAHCSTNPRTWTSFSVVSVAWARSALLVDAKNITVYLSPISIPTNLTTIATHGATAMVLSPAAANPFHTRVS